MKPASSASAAAESLKKLRLKKSTKAPEPAPPPPPESAASRQRYVYVTISVNKNDQAALNQLRDRFRVESSGEATRAIAIKGAIRHALRNMTADDIRRVLAELDAEDRRKRR